MGVLKYNVPSCPLQLPLQGRLEGLEEKMSAGKIASAEQVRGGCSDLWILLSPFSESLCYKGNSFCRAVSPQVRNKGWVELGTDPGRLQLRSTAGVAGYRARSGLYHKRELKSRPGEAETNPHLLSSPTT